MSKVVVGIDLGTVNTCVATYDGNKVNILHIGNDRTTPSCVYYDPKTPNMYYGRSAKNKNNKNIIYDVKRFIGRHFNDPIVQQISNNYQFVIKSDSDNNVNFEVPYNNSSVSKRPEEISMELLKYIKEEIRRVYKCNDIEAVITVPAYFDNNQREKTKWAATKAGINVLKLINEPTAAALSYFNSDIKKNLTAMVFDLGGGTFDVSVIDRKNDEIIVKTVAGDSALGGRNFDENIMNYFKEHLKEQGKTVEKAKERLLKAEAVTFKEILSSHEVAEKTVIELYKNEDVYLRLDRNRFNKINQIDFDKCLNLIKKCLDDNNIKRENIDEVIMVGGSSKIPKLQDMLRNYFGDVKLKCDLDQDEVVARGAAIQAYIMSYNAKNHLKIRDVIPLTLGIAVNFDEMSTIIPRNTEIPFSKTKHYDTTCDNQEGFSFRIFEGERAYIKYNNLLGTLQINDIPRKPARQLTASVTFAVDESGILSVRAQCADQNSVLQIGLNKNDDEIKCKLTDAEKNSVYDREFKKFTAAKRKLTIILNKHGDPGDFHTLLKNTSLEEQNNITKKLYEEKSSKVIKELKSSWNEYLGIKTNSGIWDFFKLKN